MPRLGAKDRSDYREAAEPRENAKELGRQNSGGLSFGPYFEQTCAMEWHHCPFSQIARAAPAPVPQRHLAVACWPSAQAAIMGLCAWVALAIPTDTTIANIATAKVFNIVSSSLCVENSDFYMSQHERFMNKRPAKGGSIHGRRLCCL
jgi:hypothetical protein